MKVVVGTFACSKSGTGTGTQQVTFAAPSPPRLVFLQATGQTAAGGTTVASSCFGFATPFAQRSVAGYSATAAAIGDTGKFTSQTDVIVLLSNANGGIDAVGNLVSFDTITPGVTYGFTINWTNAPASASVQVQYKVVCGDDLGAIEIGTKTFAAATGSQQIQNQMRFAPDCILALSANELSTVSALDDNFMLGFARKGPPIKQAVCSWLDNDGSDPMAVAERGTDSLFLAFLGPAADQAGGTATLSSFDADGVHVNFATAPLATSTIFYCMIQGGAWDVMKVVKPTGVAPQANNQTAAFVPRGVLSMTVQQVVETLSTGNAGTSGVGTGFSDGVNEAAIANVSNDAQATSVTRRMLSTTKSLLMSTATALAAEANMTFAGTTTISINWTTNDAFARLFFLLVMGDGPDRYAGYTDLGTANYNITTGEEQVGGPFTATMAGTIAAGWMDLDALGSGAGSQVVKQVVYKGATLSTATLLGTSDPVTKNKNDPRQLVPVAYSSPPAVANGDVLWVGYHSGDTQLVLRQWHVAGASGASQFKTQPYASGPISPFGASTAAVERIASFVRISAAGASFARTASDALASFGDSVARTATRSLTDALASTVESIARTATRAVADALASVAETLAVRPSRAVTDAAVVSPSDSVASLRGRSLSDALASPTDSIARRATRLLADAVASVTDVLSIRFAKTTADVIASVADSLATRVARLLSDALAAPSDQLSKIAPRGLSDAVVASPSDSIVSRAVRALTDAAAAFSDAVTRRVARTLADALATVGDSLVGGRTFFRTAADVAATVSDAIKAAPRRALTDALAALADQPSVTVARRTADTATTFSDSVAAHHGVVRAAADTITAFTDGIARSLQRQLADAIASVADVLVGSRTSGLLRQVADALLSMSDSIAAWRRPAGAWSGAAVVTVEAVAETTRALAAIDPTEDQATTATAETGLVRATGEVAPAERPDTSPTRT